MSGVSVRRLGRDDAASASDALRDLYHRDPFDQRRAAEVLGDESNVLLIGEIAGTPAGYCFAHLLDRLDGGRALFIYDIATGEAFRRRGVATAIVTTLLELARIAGCAKVFVVTERSNEAATGLYASLGASAAGDDDVVFSWAPAGR
jgi:ribosomal protein S18 acetylase RimI-like enzyme